jgi:CRISPR-associated endonuclease/helicase Cas3
LHDLGKATFEFYQYIGSATGLIDPDEDDYIDASGKKGKIDHSSAVPRLFINIFQIKARIVFLFPKFYL